MAEGLSSSTFHSMHISCFVSFARTKLDRISEIIPTAKQFREPGSLLCVLGSFVGCGVGAGNLAMD